MRACVCARLLLCALLPLPVPVLVGSVQGEVVLAGGPEGDGGGAGGGGGPQFAGRHRQGAGAGGGAGGGGDGGAAGGGTVRAARGHTVTLRCYVLNLGDKAVSWVRSRDLQILSHGGAVFTADARVSVPAPAAPAPGPAPPPPHALTIARLRDSDAGRYECQLNTEPKMSLFFDLVVLDKAEATETPPVAASTEAARGWAGVAVWAAEPVVSARAGGPAELACGARALPTPGPAPAPPASAPALDIRWLRGGKPLVIQEGMAVSRLAEATRAESRLRLASARPEDAGPYVCAVGGGGGGGGGAASASLTLLVSDSDSDGDSDSDSDGDGDSDSDSDARTRAGTDDVGQMEAMQRDESAGAGRASAGGAARAAGGVAGAGGVAPVAAAVCLLGVLLARLAAL